MVAMKGTVTVLAALALAGGCGGRQMLDLPAVDGGGAGASGSAGAGTVGAAGMTGGGAMTGVAGSTGSAGSTGTTGVPFKTAGIDLTLAPPTFSMTCDSGIGVVTFFNPCLVGFSLSNSLDPSSPSPHEVECTVANAAQTIAWTFLVVFPPGQNPQQLVLTPTSVGADLNGERAQISNIKGALTFTVVSPTQRAFEGRFTGNVTWIEASGGTVQCKIDTALWGAPGNFG
jgi:hypothetical protein